MKMYSVRYVHKISPSASDTKEPIELNQEDLVNRRALGAALRKTKVLSKGERLTHFQVRSNEVVCFPAASVWQSIVLVPTK